MDVICYRRIRVVHAIGRPENATRCADGRKERAAEIEASYRRLPDFSESLRTSSSDRRASRARSPFRDTTLTPVQPQTTPPWSAVPPRAPPPLHPHLLQQMRREHMQLPSRPLRLQIHLRASAPRQAGTASRTRPTFRCGAGTKISNRYSKANSLSALGRYQMSGSNGASSARASMERGSFACGCRYAGFAIPRPS